MGRYKLNFCYIPKSAYGQNMRSAMTAYQWRKLSDYVRSVEVCAGCWQKYKSSELEAHEVWTWKNSGKQILRRIVPLCKKCHRAVHIGRAYACGEEERYAEHFMRVRKISRNKYKKLLNEAWNDLERRSHIKWHLVTTPEEAWDIAKRNQEIIKHRLEKHPVENNGKNKK